MQAGLAALGTLAGLGAWLQGQGVPMLVGAVLLGSIIPFTLTAILPTNKRLLDPALDAAGAEARALLARWGALHAVRSAAGAAAFASSRSGWPGRSEREAPVPLRTMPYGALEELVRAYLDTEEDPGDAPADGRAPRPPALAATSRRASWRRCAAGSRRAPSIWCDRTTPGASARRPAPPCERAASRRGSPP